MKKILFLIPTLSSGGAEKSLLSLLCNLDYSEYSVDILALNPTGFISDMLPSQVNVLPLSEDYLIFKESIKSSVIKSLKKLSFSDAYERIIFSAVLRKYNFSNIAEQKTFKYIRKFFNDYGHYDAAISYLEKTTNYILSECIDAKVKIGYFHTDYTKLKVDAELDCSLMKSLDYLVTVSESCADILKSSLPSFADKVRIIENIIDKKEILRQANIFNPYDKFDGTRIVTVGRLSHEKGPDIALGACKILRDEGYNIKWHMVGAIGDESIYSDIETCGMKNFFILESLQTNPYAYIYNSDIYVQPSRYEGKSIAVEEAKVLGIPVVLSNFSTSHSQIQNGVNGIISDEISPESVACAIKKLIDNKALYSKIKTALASENGNYNELKKFTALLS